MKDDKTPCADKALHDEIAPPLVPGKGKEEPGMNGASMPDDKKAADARAGFSPKKPDLPSAPGANAPPKPYEKKSPQRAGESLLSNTTPGGSAALTLGKKLSAMERKGGEFKPEKKASAMDQKSTGMKRHGGEFNPQKRA